MSQGLGKCECGVSAETLLQCSECIEQAVWGDNICECSVKLALR